jgi:hypothetical protein
MGKGVFRRLAEYLASFWVSGGADPQAGNEDTDMGQGKNGATADGKVQAGWDGGERRKPRAVIGIPYSSDPAEDTDPDEDEENVKRVGMYAFMMAVAAAAVMILAA